MFTLSHSPTITPHTLSHCHNLCLSLHAQFHTVTLPGYHPLQINTLSHSPSITRYKFSHCHIPRLSPVTHFHIVTLTGYHLSHTFTLSHSPAITHCTISHFHTLKLSCLTHFHTVTLPGYNSLQSLIQFLQLFTPLLGSLPPVYLKLPMFTLIYQHLHLLLPVYPNIVIFVQFVSIYPS